MGEHHRHTEFLRQCLQYDAGSTCQELEKGIARLQRDARCVKRAAWLMAMFAGLAAAAFGYGSALVENYPYNTQQVIFNSICAVGLGSLISLMAFAALGLSYRRKLNQMREECRQKVAKLLKSHFDNSVPMVPQARNISAAGSDQTVTLVARTTSLVPGENPG